jgi:hypothetical protein
MLDVRDRAVVEDLKVRRLDVGRLVDGSRIQTRVIVNERTGGKRDCDSAHPRSDRMP